MHTFINDLSIEANPAKQTSSWTLLKRVIDITFELRKYKIERIRAPKQFVGMRIGMMETCAELLDKFKNDHEKTALINGLLSNRIEFPDEVIEERMAALQENKLLDVYLHTESSGLLCEAHCLERPVISYCTLSQFEAQFISADLVIIREDDSTHKKPINIKNIATNEHVAAHQNFLTEILHSLIFIKTRWQPIDNPIWNDQTKILLEELEFPNHKAQDKIAELENVGTLVAVNNGWTFDKIITGKNNSGQHKRKIFRANSGRRIAYLSIDFKRENGAFEVHDHNGVHKGQITFLGTYDREAQSNHNIHV